METNMIRFLKKFIVALYRRGIREIPCYGDRYEKGILALECELSKLLSEDAFDNIADLFLMVPVQESHEKFAEKLFVLNGDMLNFASIKNPYWEKATIGEIKDITIQKINNEETPGLEISDEQYQKLAELFCVATGV